MEVPYNHENEQVNAMLAKRQGCLFSGNRKGCTNNASPNSKNKNIIVQMKKIKFV